jgi:hypothetical protein
MMIASGRKPPVDFLDENQIDTIEVKNSVTRMSHLFLTGGIYGTLYRIGFWSW